MSSADDLLILRGFLAEGRYAEAVAWYERVKDVMSPDRLAQVQAELISARDIKRKRGSKIDTDGFVTIVREYNIAAAVRGYMDANMSLEEAAARVGEEGVRDTTAEDGTRRSHVGESTAKRLYLKWKPPSSQSNATFDYPD